MLDLSKLTTEDGGHIEVIFEDNSFAQDIIKSFDQDVFQQEIRMMVNQSGLSAKEGEVIYLLFNSYGKYRCMNKSDYDKWNNAEEKKWGHGIPSSVSAVMDAISLMEMVGILPASGDITIGVYSCDVNVEEFSGPSDEQLSEIDMLDLDNVDAKIAEVMNNGKCEACLMTGCGRRKSFSMEAFLEVFGPTTKS